MTKVEGQLPRASKRPRKVTETGGRRLGGSKSHSPAVGERGQVGKNRRSKVYQAGAAPEIVQMFESQQLYFVGCKNDILPCVDDQLTEVPALQRGLEVPSWREDKNHYNLLVQTKFSLKNQKTKRHQPGGSRAPTPATAWRARRTSQTRSCSRGMRRWRRKRSRERGWFS